MEKKKERNVHLLVRLVKYTCNSGVVVTCKEEEEEEEEQLKLMKS